MFLEVNLVKLYVEMILLDFRTSPIKADQGMHLVLRQIGNQVLLDPISIQPLNCLHLNFLQVKLALELRYEDQQRSLSERETRLKEKVLCKCHV